MAFSGVEAAELLAERLATFGDYEDVYRVGHSVVFTIEGVEYTCEPTTSEPRPRV